MSSLTINNKAVIIAACVLSVGVLVCTLPSVLFHKSKHVSLQVIDFGSPEPKTYYAPLKKNKIKIISTKIYGDKDTSIEKYKDRVSIGITTKQYSEHVHMTNISEPNIKLYQEADEWFQVYFDDQRVSPIFPLALANVETPGRADHTITWSALFPSKVVPFELVDSFDVTYVARDPVTYDTLMHECSTRDRGALQMSPTYGTNNSFYNSLMSASEVEKLSNIQIADGAKWWVAGASDKSGDRFNIHDVCLRLAASADTATHQIRAKNIPIQNNAELIVMLAMYHHRSGVWQVSGAGGWLSTESCLNYVHKICSQEMIDVLKNYYTENPDVYTLDSKTAAALVSDYKQYTTSSLEASYPIKVLYSYLVLTNKYNKG